MAAPLGKAARVAARLAKGVSLSIIIPTRNEALGIVGALTQLQPLRRRGVEIIVVDAMSEDDTATLARPLADKVVASKIKSRAHQQNAGALAARGDVYLFLHADTSLPEHADRLVAQALASPAYLWGHFAAQLDSTKPLLRITGWMMNARSRFTHIATGDQAIFVRSEVFHAVGGFPMLMLMEDVMLSKLLRARARPTLIAAAVRTSARRWETQGVCRTILLMWWLRLAFFIGIPAAQLERQYYPERRQP